MDEGRQILRNIQRVARLFVTKTVYTAVIDLVVAIPTATFPLLPRQFTVASTVTIGIPSFLLALAPSSGPWRPEGFVRSVATFAVPAGVAIGIGTAAGYLLARYGFDVGLIHSRTAATGIIVFCGLAVVLRLERDRGRSRLILGLSAPRCSRSTRSRSSSRSSASSTSSQRPPARRSPPGPPAPILGIGGMLAGLRLTHA